MKKLNLFFLGSLALGTCVCVNGLLARPGWVADSLQKEVAEILKYLGMLITSLLGIYALKRKTSLETDDPETPKRLTPAGRIYCAWIVVLLMMTIGSSILGDRADARITKAAKENGDAELQKRLKQQYEQYVSSLREATGKIDVDLGRQTTKLNEATDKVGNVQTTLTGTTNQLLIAQRDLRLANMSVTNMLLKVSVPGAQHPQSTAIDKLRSYTEKRLRQTYELYCRTQNQSSGPDENCVSAAGGLDDWSRTFDILSFLDPDDHLEVRIVLTLGSFRAALTAEDGPKGHPHPLRLPLLHFVTIDDLHSPLLTSSLGDLGESHSLGFTIAMDSDVNPFAKKAYYSRDTDFSAFEVNVCDNHGDSESKEVIQRHLDKFPSNVNWLVNVVIFDDSAMKRAFEKPYELRPSLPGTRFRSCIRIDYQTH